jgi:hypothetical protein
MKSPWLRPRSSSYTLLISWVQDAEAFLGGVTVDEMRNSSAVRRDIESKVSLAYYIYISLFVHIQGMLTTSVCYELILLRTDSVFFFKLTFLNLY